MALSPSASPLPAAAGTQRCGVCGRDSRQTIFRPMAPEQAPDLDLRPGEALRGTMEHWLQQCPHCGYTAPDITNAHPGAVAAVGAAPFRALIQDESHPPLARRFLGWAHVLEETGALAAAAEATLQAAWVADDAGRADLARTWRLEAVALWRCGPPLDHEQAVRVVDALRRAGAWDDAAAAAEQIAQSKPPEAVAEVVGLEQRLIAARDGGRHTIASALPPPSRRPHVAHRAAGAGPGFWAWLKGLFGRR